jgi:anti-sigma regulatory factor (Ser/Thr protein kinase)
MPGRAAVHRDCGGVGVRTEPDGPGLVLELTGTLTAAGCRDLCDVLVDALTRADHVLVDVNRLSLERPGLVLAFACALAEAGGWPQARLAVFTEDRLLREVVGSFGPGRTVPVAPDVDLARARCAVMPPRVLVSWDHPPEPDVPATVRRRLAARVDAWGVDADTAEELSLMVTELVTNAIEHGRTRLRLTVALDAGAVEIQVRDHSALRPRLQPTDPLARRGRGLQVVDALASRWGWTFHPVGKTVWATMAAGGRRPAPLGSGA